MKKILATGVFILLLLSLSFNIAGKQEMGSKLITVDDDGWSANYKSIQEAINNANDGDTIFVYNGIYYGNVKIKKSINLIGENKNNTIIDGRGSVDVITVYADNVEINRFTIRNAGGGLKIGIELRNVQNCFVENNIIKDNQIGIDLYRSSNNIIAGNYLTNNTWEGMSIISGQNNNIYNNIAERNGVGVSFNNCSQSYVISNVLTSNSIDALELWYSENNSIINNYIHGGTQLLYSCDNIFYSNYINGYLLLTYFSNHTEIIYNNMYVSVKSYCFRDSYYTNWNKNYWSNWPNFLPRPIWGYNNRIIHCLTFDWHPAQEPYDIPVPEV